MRTNNLFRVARPCCLNPVRPSCRGSTILTPPWHCISSLSELESLERDRERTKHTKLQEPSACLTEGKYVALRRKKSPLVHLLANASDDLPELSAAEGN